MMPGNLWERLGLGLVGETTAAQAGQDTVLILIFGYKWNLH